MRRQCLGGICGGCSETLPHPRQPYVQFWAIETELDELDREGMIIAVAVALDCTREAAVQIAGRAAQSEGKSFDESLTSYFWTHTDGRIPKNVEPYRGRVASRGLSSIQPDIPANPAPLTGRIQSRGGN